MKRGFMVVALLIGRAASALAAPPGIETSTLANGLEVVLAPDSGARAADVAVWYRTGPRVEEPGRSGITHLFERLMFRGTESRGPGEYRRLLQAEGGVVNTYTTADFTSFFATVPEQAVDLALKLESERMAKLKLSAADLAEERAAVARERRAFLETNPLGRGVEKLYATAFPGHGYGSPVIGLEDDVRRIALDQALEYYRDRYGPNNAVVTVVGRFDKAAALASIRSYFEPLPRRGAAAKPAPLPAPRPRGTASSPGRFPLVLVGWRAPASADPGTPALEILARVLGSGSEGRLERPDSGAVAQARAAFDPARDASLFYALAVLKTPADSTAAQRMLTGAIGKLASEPVTAGELDRAKREWELDMLAGQQTARGRARALGTALLVDGDAGSTARRLQAVRDLTPVDLEAAARKVFRPESRSVVLIMPAPGPPRPGAASKGAR